MFATINIAKPAGPTSHDVVAKVRKCFNLKRVGHMGSLDPMSEGVLPVCLGQATRLIEYFPTDKAYRASITFGRTTETLDREGEFLTDKPCPDLTADQIEAIFEEFTGTIEQVVPLHSAVHVDGKKLYEYAHKGLEVPDELPKRPITIYSLKLVELQTEADPDHPTAIVDVACSSGTYIRALARDMGERLGMGAYLSGLIRTLHGDFTLEEAVPLETLITCENPEQYLLNPLEKLGLPILKLSTFKRANLLANGMKIPHLPQEGIQKGQRQLAAVWKDDLVAIVQVAGGQIQPTKVFQAPVNPPKTPGEPKHTPAKGRVPRPASQPDATSNTPLPQQEMPK